MDWNSDFWVDHDPNHHGDEKSFADDPGFQDGFQWTCCEATGDAPGCIVTRHVSVDDNKHTRSRLLPNAK